jgi:hypothetical protein
LWKESEEKEYGRVSSSRLRGTQNDIEKKGLPMKSLIAGHLEHISSKVFDDYHDEITSLVVKQQVARLNYKAKDIVAFDSLFVTESVNV